MSDLREVECYLILERDGRGPRWKPPIVAGVRKNKPKLESYQIAVKVKLKIPMSLFDTFIPVLEAEVTEPDVIAPTIQVEPEPV